MPAIVPAPPAHAHAAAAPVARDGFWTDPTGRTDVQLLVVGHRVVAARGTVDQKPAETGSTVTCERATFSFIGPVGQAGNRSSATFFRFDEDGEPWFSITGRVVSATHISGRLVKGAGGHGDFCEGSVTFSASPARA